MRALLIASVLALRDWTVARRQLLGDRRSRLLRRRRQFVRPGRVDEATRLSLTAWGLNGVMLVFGAIFGVRSLLPDGGRPAASTLDQALVALSATWMAAVTVVGYILFRRPGPPPEHLRILDIPVCFRIVARRDNILAV